jgi:lipoprotein NlpD
MKFSRFLLIICSFSGILFQVGCATRTSPAPVVDRSTGGKSQEPVAPGYYRVKRGDTLLRIALDHGQSYKDIAEWNNLADANQIEVDQVIRVTPAKGSKAVSQKIEVKQEPIENKTKELSKNKVISDKTPEKNAKLASEDSKIEKNKSEALSESGIKLSWPSKGDVLERFDEVKNKGIDIAGKSGDPVLSAAEGKVVYAGNSLRGYGNLVIVKHDNTFLTAYAHNKSLLVKEGDLVKKSQKIAEMGDTDATRVKLHFELRKNGKPVDPIDYLP